MKLASVIFITTAALGCVTSTPIIISGDGPVQFQPESIAAGQKFLSDCEQRFNLLEGQNITARKIGHGTMLVDLVFQSNSAEAYWFAYWADSMLYLEVSLDMQERIADICQEQTGYGRWLAKYDSVKKCTVIEVPHSDPERYVLFQVLCRFIGQEWLHNVAIDK